MKASINLLLTFLLCIISSCKLANNKNDADFLQWNKTTLASIEKDGLESFGTDEKSSYKNRFEAFKAREGLVKVKKNSLRYEFWQELDQDNLLGKSFYIGEFADIDHLIPVQTDHRFRGKLTT